MEGEVCALLKDESELRDPKGSKKKIKKNPNPKGAGLP